MVVSLTAVLVVYSVPWGCHPHRHDRSTGGLSTFVPYGFWWFPTLDESLLARPGAPQADVLMRASPSIQTWVSLQMWYPTLGALTLGSSSWLLCLDSCGPWFCFTCGTRSEFFCQVFSLLLSDSSSYIQSRLWLPFLIGLVSFCSQTSLPFLGLSTLLQPLLLPTFQANPRCHVLCKALPTPACTDKVLSSSANYCRFTN